MPTVMGWSCRCLYEASVSVREYTVSTTQLLAYIHYHLVSDYSKCGSLSTRSGLPPKSAYPHSLRCSALWHRFATSLCRPSARTPVPITIQWSGYRSVKPKDSSKANIKDHRRDQSHSGSLSASSVTAAPHCLSHRDVTEL